MNRWILGMAALGLCVATQSADAQVYAYGVPSSAVYAPGSVYPAPVYAAPVHPAPAYLAPVYPAPVYVQPSPFVASAYYAPAYVAPAPVVQMGYGVPVGIPTRSVMAAPVIVGPGAVRQTTRVSPHNYTQTVRAYGPTVGPHYSRIRVHTGLFGTTVRERVR